MKILSIDFDIIMYPCIKLYNDKVGGDCNPTELWKFLEEQYDLQNFVNYDAKYLRKVGQILKAAVEGGAKLVPIQEHQEVVDYLKKTPTYDEDTYEIYNVDFHHDLWYRDNEDKNSITVFDNYNCSNWMGYLLLKEKATECHWICAGNSGGYPQLEDRETLKSKMRLSDFDTSDLEFDYVFFCLSPQWVPYQFQHLYYLLVELCGKGERL